MYYTISLFFLAWIVPSVLLFFLPLPQKMSSFQFFLTHFFFIAGYLLLALTMSYWLIKRLIDQKKKTLTYCCIFSLVLFGFHYGVVIVSGNDTLVFSAAATANLFFAASLLGVALSTAIKRVGELIPVCLTAAAADITSVSIGPTSQIIEKITTYYEEGMTGTPSFFNFILIKASFPGSTLPLPLFGVTDWILLTLLSAAMIRLGKCDNLLAGVAPQQGFIYIPITGVAIFTGLVFAQISQLFIPAMLFIALFFIAFLVFRYRVLKELSKSDLGYSLVFPPLVVFTIYLLSAQAF